MNEESRQSDIAGEVDAAARRLADSTRTVPDPADSYALVAALQSTVTSLAHVARQLAGWHDTAVEGVEYSGEDERGDGSGTAAAAQELGLAHEALTSAAEHIASAHSANGVVRWNPSQSAEH